MAGGSPTPARMVSRKETMQLAQKDEEVLRREVSQMLSTSHRLASAGVTMSRDDDHRHCG